MSATWSLCSPVKSRNFQGCRFFPDWHRRAASSTASIFSCSTGWGRYFRMLRLSRITASSSIIGLRLSLFFIALPDMTPQADFTLCHHSTDTAGRQGKGVLLAFPAEAAYNKPVNNFCRKECCSRASVSSRSDTSGSAHLDAGNAGGASDCTPGRSHHRQYADHLHL